MTIEPGFFLSRGDVIDGPWFPRQLFWPRLQFYPGNSASGSGSRGATRLWKFRVLPYTRRQERPPETTWPQASSDPRKNPLLRVWGKMCWYIYNVITVANICSKALLRTRHDGKYFTNTSFNLFGNPIFLIPILQMEWPSLVTHTGQEAGQHTLRKIQSQSFK